MTSIEERGDDVLVVRVAEKRIDARSAPIFKAGVVPRIVERPRKVVLDLTLVEFMDSVGLGTVVSLLKLRKGGTLGVVGANGAVRRLFALTRMDRVFRMYDSLDDAMAAV